MKTIIHDLNKKYLKKLHFNELDKIIDAKGCINSCIGCFSCWIKHPTRCIYNDEYSTITTALKSSNELIIISKNRFGCYSTEVKRVLERCIGYVHPHFTIREGMIHHKQRYQKRLKIIVYFYGNINDADKKCLTDLVKANSINLNAKEYEVHFIKNIKEIDNVHID